ncbi:MAG: DUF3467 domain-containing protein [Methanosarcina vacuolata]|jgi:hypothetical protein|nr:DUF3467 domain-containing protein [Methanosarcina vacuolata]
MDQSFEDNVAEENIEEEKTQKTRIYRTPLFTKLYATNLSVFKTDVDVRIEFFNEKGTSEDEVVFYSDGLAMLTMEAAKKLSIKLEKIIEEYESENGEIEIREDRKSEIKKEE